MMEVNLLAYGSFINSEGTKRGEYLAKRIQDLHLMQNVFLKTDLRALMNSDYEQPTRDTLLFIELDRGNNGLADQEVSRVQKCVLSRKLEA